MDGVNELDENSKISNLLDPDAEKQTFGRKSQNWPNLGRKCHFTLLYYTHLRQITTQIGTFKSKRVKFATSRPPPCPTAVFKYTSCHM
ncbi:hypothetical protein Hanom_Chr02g00110221 [Helianthus anomalus]